MTEAAEVLIGSPKRETKRRKTVQGEQNQSINYDEAVTEAKQIIAQMDSSRWRMRLGELADKVEKAYGEARLKRFAAEIGIAACTLARCRSVFRAWQAKEAPAPKSYSVAQELQTHPNRFELVRKNPGMTKREARQHMRRLRKEGAQASFAVHQREELKRWFRAVVRHATEAVRDSQLVDGDVSPALRQSLRENIEPTLLPALRDGRDALIRLVEFLERLAEAEEEEPSEQLPAQAAE